VLERILESLFKGFSPKTIEFFYALRANNNKAWFEENREDYEKFVLEPMRELVKALSGTIHEIDPAIDTRPSVGKTISRIYRDTRFSNDKSPYRSRMWIFFRQLRQNSTGFPGFYFEIDPEYYCFGMGMYKAEKEDMDRLREFIKEKPEEFRRAADFYYREDNIYKLEGESYKRMDDSAVKEELKPWYRKKSFYLEYLKPIDRTVMSAKVVENIKEAYKTMAPLYTLLCRVHDGVLFQTKDSKKEA